MLCTLYCNCFERAQIADATFMESTDNDDLLVIKDALTPNALHFKWYKDANRRLRIDNTHNLLGEACFCGLFFDLSRQPARPATPKSKFMISCCVECCLLLCVAGREAVGDNGES